MSNELKPYIVTQPIRGIQMFLVEARSKKEAMALVDASDESICALGFRLECHGKANMACLDIPE